MDFMELILLIFFCFSTFPDFKCETEFDPVSYCVDEQETAWNKMRRLPPNTDLSVCSAKQQKSCLDKSKCTTGLTATCELYNGEDECACEKDVPLSCLRSDASNCDMEANCKETEEGICKINDSKKECGCRKMDCTGNGKLENGRLNCDYNRCNATCDENYTLLGNIPKDCCHLLYTGVEFKCIPAKCPKLEELKCKYSLRQSFACQNSEKEACYVNTSEKFIRYKCHCTHRKYCEADDVENGKVTCKTSDDRNSTKCQYTCDPHFELKGSSQLYCNHEGEWSADFPKCVHVDCSQEEIDICDDETRCRATEEISCEKTESKPVCGCRKIVNDTDFGCRLKHIVENGRLQCEGNRCLVICNDNYYLEGEPINKCENKGIYGSRWKNEMAECKPLTYNCALPEKQEGTYRRCTTRSLNEPWDCTFQCKENYLQVGGANHITCYSDGELSEKPIDCQTKYNGRCTYWDDRWEIIPRGIVVIKSGRKMKSESRSYHLNYSDFEKLYIYCKDEFNLEGDKNVKCNSSSGEWIMNNATCQLKDPYDCEEIITNKGTTINCTGESKSSPWYCDMECENGYVHVAGEKRIECLYGQEWSADPLVCDRTYNCSMDFNRNVIADCEEKRFDKPWQCKFTCNPGYFMRNTLKKELQKIKLTCQRDTKWSEDLPYCTERFKCEPIDHRDETGRSVSCTTHSDNSYSCKIYCRLSFEIYNGQEIVYCKENGQWSATYLSCKKK